MNVVAIRVRILLVMLIRIIIAKIASIIIVIGIIISWLSGTILESIVATIARTSIDITTT